MVPVVVEDCEGACELVCCTIS